MAAALRDQADEADALAAELEARAANVNAPAAPAGLQNQSSFLASINSALFGGKMTDAQRAGCLALCAAGAGALPLGWMAYVLATAHHETGASYDPGQVESLNYSVDGLLKTFSRARISETEAARVGRSVDHPADQVAIANAVYGGPWGAQNLGNTEPGDGWRYRGRSWPQLTGRRNYAKADAALGLDGALLADPELIGRLDIAAGVMVRGMREGWFTGKRLNDFIRSRGSEAQFTNARAIVNPDANGPKVARYALAFQDALTAGGWL